MANQQQEDPKRNEQNRSEQSQQQEADNKKRKSLTDEEKLKLEKDAKKQAIDVLEAKESIEEAPKIGEVQSGKLIQPEDVAPAERAHVLAEEDIKLADQPEKISHELVQQGPVHQPGYLPGRSPSQQPVEDHENAEFYAKLRDDSAKGIEQGGGFERAEVFVKKSGAAGTAGSDSTGSTRSGSTGTGSASTSSVGKASGTDSTGSGSTVTKSK